jgi:hypothetical protein
LVVVPPTGAALAEVAVELDDPAAIASLRATAEEEQRERDEWLRRLLGAIREGNPGARRRRPGDAPHACTSRDGN